MRYTECEINGEQKRSVPGRIPQRKHNLNEEVPYVDSLPRYVARINHKMDNIPTDSNSTDIGGSGLCLQQASTNVALVSAQLNFLNSFAGPCRYVILYVELKINNEIPS